MNGAHRGAATTHHAAAFTILRRFAGLRVARGLLDERRMRCLSLVILIGAKEEDARMFFEEEEPPVPYSWRPRRLGG
jgi:hypothetical protein